MSETIAHNPDAKQEIKKINEIKLVEFDVIYFKSLEGNDGWIALDHTNCTNQRYFTVCAEDGTKIGIVGVYDTANDQNIVHTVIAPQYRGQGLAAKCKNAIMDTLGLPFLTLSISLDNTASLRAAAKLPGIEQISDDQYANRFHKIKYRLPRPTKSE